MKRAADGTMHVYINGEDQGVASTNIPKVICISNGNIAAHIVS